MKAGQLIKFPSNTTDATRRSTREAYSAPTIGALRFTARSAYRMAA